MDYNRVSLNQPITLVGIAQRINQPELAPQEIKKLWDTFYQRKLAFPHSNDKIYSVYTDYDSRGSYSCVIGVEVDLSSRANYPGIIITIAPGNYAHYSLPNSQPETIVNFWKSLAEQSLPYNRAFTTDFEVHTPSSVDIYVAQN